MECSTGTLFISHQFAHHSLLQSNRQERMKGGQLARCIRDRERGGRIPIVTIDAGTEDGYPQCQELIRGLLGPAPKKFRAAQPDEVTEDASKNVRLLPVHFRFTIIYGL